MIAVVPLNHCSVCVADGAVLDVNTTVVAASSTVSLQWMKNGIAIANANATTLTVTNTAALGTGAYTFVRKIGNCIDTSNAKKRLNWEPSTNFEEGLQKTYAWFQKNQSLYGDSESYFI